MKPTFKRMRPEYVGKTIQEVGYTVARMVHPMAPFLPMVVAVLPDGYRAAAVDERDESGDPAQVLAHMCDRLRIGIEGVAFRDDYIPA